MSDIFVFCVQILKVLSRNFFENDSLLFLVFGQMDEKKFLMNKKNLFLGGGLLMVLLVSGGYVFGKKFFQSNDLERGKIIQLEDGRKIRLKESSSINRRGNLEERPNLTGKIKTINGNEIIIEKFASQGGGMRQRMSGNQTGSNLNGEKDERPTSTIEGVATVTIDSTTVLVKSPRGMRRPDQENKTEKIQQSDLKEGAIISVWSEKQENSEKELATKIMLRAD